MIILMEGIKKAMNERNLNEGQWEDRKQWSLGVGQRRKMFWNQCAYLYSSVHIINTRTEHHLCRPVVSLSCFQKGAFCTGIKIFSILPHSFISLRNEKAQLKVVLRRSQYINTHFFYSVDELVIFKDDPQYCIWNLYSICTVIIMYVSLIQYILYEIRTQDEVTVWRLIIVPLKGWKSSNIWEQC